MDKYLRPNYSRVSQNSSQIWSTRTLEARIKAHTCQHPDNLCHCTKNSEQGVIYRIYREEDCRGGYLSRVQSGANWDNSPNYTLTPIFDKWSATRHEGVSPDNANTDTDTRTCLGSSGHRVMGGHYNGYDYRDNSPLKFNIRRKQVGAICTLDDI